MAVWVERGGAGGALYALLHGLGATSEMWRPLTACIERAGASWLAPDLRGHGRSERAGSYSYDDYARDIAALIDRPAIIVGHSMGGVIGLRLASGDFGWTPDAVFGLGIKIRWSAEEIEKIGARADAPAKMFTSQAEAESFFLKVIGLAGADPAFAAGGVKQEDDVWRLAGDPKTNRIGAPNTAALVSAARAPFHLAAGANDHVTSLADMQPFDPRAVVLEGCGHNAMVEAPEAVWAWMSARR